MRNLALLVGTARIICYNDGFLGLDFAYWIVLTWGFGILGHAIYAFFGEHRVSKVYAEEKQRDLAGRR